MAYRVGRYAGRHTLYDELDPAAAAARRAFASPVTEDERLAQWALLKEVEDRRVEEIRKRSVQAVEYSELVEATLASPKCGNQVCWCSNNEGPQSSQGYHIQNAMPVSLHFPTFIIHCLCRLFVGRVGAEAELELMGVESSGVLMSIHSLMVA